jgi:hypothetical protein
MSQQPDLPVSTPPPPRSAIEYGEEYMSRLRSFIASEDVLERNGYVIHPYSTEQLEFKKRCFICGKSEFAPPFPGSELNNKQSWPNLPKIPNLPSPDLPNPDLAVRQYQLAIVRPILKTKT